MVPRWALRAVPCEKYANWRTHVVAFVVLPPDEDDSPSSGSSDDGEE